jgi:hypothetical protein
MPEHQELKDQARTKTRELLAQSQSFLAMDRSEQMALYKDLVDAHYNDLAEAQGLATEMAVAGDLINKDRHQNDRLGRAGQTTADILSDTVRKVNFPGFVSDLLNGVFDANLNANIKQMKAFQDLLKSASQSLSVFVNSIKDDDAMYRLAELDSKYKVKMEKIRARGGARGGMGGDAPATANPGAAAGTPDATVPKPVLIDQSGKKVNINDSSIQAKILDAKLAMAKERRTMLRETILMGVSRLVVEKGTIRAEVKFRIDASESTTNEDTANANETNSFGFGYGGGIFGGPSFSFNHSESKITVASSESQLDTSSSTEMTGFVEIQFKSDYFKLDNFRETFDLGTGQVAVGQLPAGAAPAQPIPAAPQPVAQPIPQ